MGGAGQTLWSLGPGLWMGMFVLIAGIALMLALRTAGWSQPDTMNAPPSLRWVAGVLDRLPVPTTREILRELEEVWGVVADDPFALGESSLERDRIVVLSRGASPQVGRASKIVGWKSLGWDPLGSRADVEILGAFLVGREGGGQRAREIETELSLQAAGLVWSPTDAKGGVPRLLTVRIRRGDDQVLICIPRVLVTESFHVLGTDGAGQDVLGVLLKSLPQSVVPGLVAVAIGVAGGVLLGTLGSGFLGRLAMRLGNSVVSLALSLPQLLVMLLAITVLNVSQFGLMVALGLASVPRVAHVVRERIRLFQRLQFVEAARELGLHRRRILGYHILWANCRALLITHASFLFADVVMLEATVSYFRFGRTALIGSLGGLIARDQGGLQSGVLWLVLPAMLLLSAMVLGFYLFGDWMTKGTAEA